MFMDLWTNRLLALTAAGLLTATSAGAAAAPATTGAPAKPKAPELFPDTVVAKGKGFEIKRSQLDDALTGLKSAAAARGQVIPPEQVAMLEPQLLDRIIQIRILVGQATDADKTVAKEASAKRLEAIANRAGTQEALNRQLKAMGTSQEELRTRMIEESTAEAVLERELKISTTEAQAKKFYDDNPAKFEQPEMVRASHILLSTRDKTTNQELSAEQKAAKRKQAEDILKRARAGEDFAALAKQYSEDPGSKDKGGEYTFPRGQMVPEFEAAAFSLKTNEVSDIVTTQFGYHIIKLSEKIPAKKVEYAKVHSDIQDYLKQQEMQNRQQEVKNFLEKLKKTSGVEILDPDLKPKDVPVGAAFDGGTKPASTGSGTK